MPTHDPRSSVPLSMPALVLSAALAGCGPGTDAPPPVRETAASPAALALPAGAEEAAGAVTADALREVIRRFSDDSLEGRGPGSAGDAAARRLLIGELEALGLEPGGEGGSWEQPFEIVGIDAEVPETWTFAAGDRRLDLAFSDEFIAFSGVQAESARVDGAELVFVGYGIEAPEYAWDDYASADLAGRVLVMLNNDPDWDEALFEGNRRLYYGRWTYKYEAAARHGAAGAIILHTIESAGYPWQVVQSSWTGAQFELPAGGEPRIQIGAWTTWEASEKLFELGGHDLESLVESAKSRDFSPVSLGIRTSLELENTVSRGVETANVLGLLAGGDPELSGQAVIYTAHHDHLGRGTPDAGGDDIYNGARDNASGVAVLLEIARAMKALPAPPRRSVLFLFTAAEEQGLLGSKHYARHPTFHPGKIAAVVNFDSANIFGRTRDLTFVGLGKSSLDEVATAAAALQGRVVVGDPYPDRGSFYRSDQFSLAKIGVPAMYLSGGTDFVEGAPGERKALAEQWVETRYHQPSDELEDDWDFAGMVEDARIGFYAGLAIARADPMPAWNPGDEFEAARLAALAEAEGL